VVWWACGYAFAFGSGNATNGFIGLTDFFLYTQDQSKYAFFFFQVS